MSDQSIAALIEANDRARSMGFLNGTSNWASVLATAVATQPDCRTCRDRDMGECMSSNDCTNGDHYQPAPQVVLWRTN
jgi:hypothetical protein